MMKGGHGQTNQLHDINWGTLDHASLVHPDYCHLITINFLFLGGGGGGDWLRLYLSFPFSLLDFPELLVHLQGWTLATRNPAIHASNLKII